MNYKMLHIPMNGEKILPMTPECKAKKVVKPFTNRRDAQIGKKVCLRIEVYSYK